jgi:hypothetical protein
MSFGPHPNVLTLIGEARRADLLPEADQLRLLKLAPTNPDRRQPWSDLPALRVVATVLALLAAFQRGSERSNRLRSSQVRWENTRCRYGRPGGKEVSAPST